MQAIQTKYLPPTNHRGSRIKASCQAGSIMVPYDHALDSWGNHKAAAEALKAKLQWDGELVGGQLPDHSYAHVFSPASDALENIVGEGAQHELTCDKPEHADGGDCIWCAAREALRR